MSIGSSSRNVNRLHHLPQRAVAQDQGQHAVAVGQVECLDRQFVEFLNAGRRQDDVAVIAVAAALGRLEIVALGRQDAAQARAGHGRC